MLWILDCWNVRSRIVTQHRNQQHQNNKNKINPTNGCPIAENSTVNRLSVRSAKFIYHFFLSRCGSVHTIFFSYTKYYYFFVVSYFWRFFPAVEKVQSLLEIAQQSWILCVVHVYHIFRNKCQCVFMNCKFYHRKRVLSTRIENEEGIAKNWKTDHRIIRTQTRARTRTHTHKRKTPKFIFIQIVLFGFIRFEFYIHTRFSFDFSVW